MTSPQIKLVQTSWARIAPSADQVAVLFYDRLFEIAPETESLFPPDRFELGKTLMQMLGVVIKGLPNIGDLPLALQQISEKHADTAILLAHDGAAREALLWTLRQGLGDDFTSDLEQAWRNVFAVLAATMTESPAATAV
jgi:hemoglobin-like flavoprotein